MGTIVNGSHSIGCTYGTCQIEGGFSSGSNLFHNFNTFDTRDIGITDVQINSGMHSNVILGVTNSSGTFINKPVELSNQSSLFILSPAGITIDGGTFYNVNSLVLSNANTINQGGSFYDVFDLNTLNPFPNQLINLSNNTFTVDIESRIKNGIDKVSLIKVSDFLEIDRDIVISAIEGNVDLDYANLHAENNIEIISEAESGLAININSSQLTAQNILIEGLGGEIGNDITGVNIYDSDLIADDLIYIYGVRGEDLDFESNFYDGVYLNQSSLITLNSNSEIFIGSRLSDLNLNKLNQVNIRNSNTNNNKNGRVFMNYVNLASEGNVLISGKGYYDTAINIENSSIDGKSGIEIIGYGHSNIFNTSGVSIKDSYLSSYNSGDTSIKIKGLGGNFLGEMNSQDNVDIALGIYIYNSSVDSDGKLDLYGVGSDGDIVLNSFGIYFDTSDVSGNSIDLKGYGGNSIMDINNFDFNFMDFPYENDGISIDNSIFYSDTTLSIDGSAGSGDLGSDNDGVSVRNSELFSNDLIIKGTGTSGSAIDDSYGVYFYDSYISTIADGSIIGNGGLDESEYSAGSDNHGVYFDKTVVESSNNYIINGEGGSGGDAMDGVTFYESDITVNNNLIIHGKGGTGKGVSQSYGVNIDEYSNLEGQNININGVGGTNTNKDNLDTYDNVGVQITNNSELKSSENIKIIGTAGQGGSLNDGIYLIDSKLKSNDSLELLGTGGTGVNLSLSYGIYGDNVNLFGNTIKLFGNGGLSLLNSLYPGDTSDNVGIGILNSELTSNNGKIIIDGVGGDLSMEGITNSNFAGSLLEGVYLDNIILNSGTNFEISGSAGKPIEGNNNNGVWINNSVFSSNSYTPDKNKIEGISYSGTSNNSGLLIMYSDISSSYQDLILSGIGALQASGNLNIGIELESTDINVGSDNNISDLFIYGSGGGGINLNGGINSYNSKYNVKGDINLYGTSKGSGFGNNSLNIINAEIAAGKSLNMQGNIINIRESSFTGTEMLNITGTNKDFADEINISNTEISGFQKILISAKTKKIENVKIKSNDKDKDKDKEEDILIKKRDVKNKISSRESIINKTPEEALKTLLNSEKNAAKELSKQLGIPNQSSMSSAEIQNMLIEAKEFMNSNY